MNPTLNQTIKVKKMTDVIDNVKPNSIQLSSTEYFTIEELLERINSGELAYCPEKLYIREKIQRESKQYRDALSTFDLETGEILYQILFPITIYKKDGKEFLINGNSRVANLLSMYAQRSPEDTVKFLDVPYNYLLNEPTDELLLAFQRYANDTTIAHSVLERLTKAESFFKSQLAKAKKTGLSDYEAKRVAVDSARRALGSISQPQLSKILAVSNASKECELLKTYIENEQISIDGASQIITLHKKLSNKKGNENLSLEFVLLSIKSIAEGEANKNHKGLTLIQERHIKLYEESLKPVKDVPKEKLNDLIESGSIDSDARDDFESAVSQHEGLEESVLVAEVKKSLSDEKTIITAEDVKAALQRLKFIPTEKIVIPVETLRETRDIFLNKNEALPIAEIKESPVVSKAVAYFNTESLKLLVAIDKYYRGSESIEILEDVNAILRKRLSALEPALGNDVEAYASIKTKIDNLAALSDNIIKKMESGKGASTESMEVPANENTDNTDVFGKPDIEVSEGNYTATVE
jgi:hypothetical protein